MLRLGPIHFQFIYFASQRFDFPVFVIVLKCSITLSGVAGLHSMVFVSSITLSGVVIVFALISFVHPAMVIVVTGARISSGWPSV